jgi:hypothetical protein
MKDSRLLKGEAPIYLAISLVITIFAWSAGFVFFPFQVQAASLTSVSDTLSDSNPGSVATHTIAFTNATSMGSLERLVITIDALNTTSTFGGIANVTGTDITATGATFAATCTGTPGEIRLLGASSSGALTFEVCTGDTIASGSKSITIKNATTRITNSTTTGSYVVRVQHTTAGGSVLNQADTRIAIVNNVQLTASVDTSFTFTINGVATGTTMLNGATTTKASTATTLPFGTLPLNTPVTLAQRLTVATNAINGFVVTVKEDQNPLSQTGADIDLFRNGEATATPIPWISPSSTLNVETTYGHIGVTSDDQDLNSGEFGSTSTPLFAGNFQATTTRTVFSATGTADGITSNIGSSTVAFRIQIGALQEAATDYTNTLTYVATPTF